MPTSFVDCIDQIEDRSAALRAAVASAVNTELRIPGCPDWTLHDLVVHVGEVQRSWAGHVRHAKADIPPVNDLFDWSAASTRTLTDALREAGPDKLCWTWWEQSDAPETAGAVARHQVQEAALHAYDAQSAIGQPVNVPSEVAIDCVDEFLVVSLGAMGEWPHRDARVDFVATEGPRWMVELTSLAKVVANPSGETDATVTGSAADVILALYSRIPPARLHIDGDAEVVGLLLDWARYSTE